MLALVQKQRAFCTTMMDIEVSIWTKIIRRRGRDRREGGQDEASEEQEEEEKEEQ